MTNNKKHSFLASLSTFYLLIIVITISTPVASLRLIYLKANTTDQPGKVVADANDHVRTADIISTPLNCGQDEKLDARNKCRKVNLAA